MGLLDSLTRKASQAITSAGSAGVRKVVKSAGDAVSGAVTATAQKITNKSEKMTFDSLPTSVDELRAMKGSELTSPFCTAALTVAALCRYAEDPQATFDMLNYLKGPQPLNGMQEAFIKDRFMDGKIYVAYSYFEGAVSENNYTPDKPYKITVFEDGHSNDEDGYARLYIRSGGADSPRPIKLRRKGEQWFLWEQYLLPDIRKPSALDPWA